MPPGGCIGGCPPGCGGGAGGAIPPGAGAPIGGGGGGGIIGAGGMFAVSPGTGWMPLSLESPPSTGFCGNGEEVPGEMPDHGPEGNGPPPLKPSPLCCPPPFPCPPVCPVRIPLPPPITPDGFPPRDWLCFPSSAFPPPLSPPVFAFPAASPSATLTSACLAYPYAAAANRSTSFASAPLPWPDTFAIAC